MNTQKIRWFNCFLLLVVAAGVSSCDPGGENTEPAQDIHVSEQLVDFGHVDVGSYAKHTVQVQNLGESDLVFSQVPEVVHQSTHEAFSFDASWLPSPGKEPGSEVIRIEPGATEELTITFAPLVATDSYAYITLYNNDPDEAYRTVVLLGSSREDMPEADVTPHEVDFGYVPSGITAEEVVEIHNVGDVDAHVLSAVVTTGPFLVVSEPESPIPPGGTAEARIRFESDGDHAIGVLQVEIAGQPSTLRAVSISANSPGSIINSPPEVSLLDPIGPAVFYDDEDLELLAEAFDDEQPDTGLFCNLASNRLGNVDQETSDPATGQVEFFFDIDESVFGVTPGLHTLTLCCADIYNDNTCLTTVVRIDSPFSEDDLDGDGYAEAEGDCDDGDPDTYPSALEQPDGADNNCDGDIDDDTIHADDDGDGLSEEEGDCDDGDALTYPNAAEQPDFLDNDCDGDIDEGTDFADDDLDGLSEALGDCDDSESTVYPGGIEWCDGLDNDCDGDFDEDCIDDVTNLAVVNGLQIDVNVAEPGQEVDLCLTVIAGPDAMVEYDWNPGAGSFAGDTDGPCVTWVAADQVGAHTVFCQVTDVTTDQSIWAFIEIWVEDWDLELDVDLRANCSLGDGRRPAIPAALLLVTLIGALGFRRR